MPLAEANQQSQSTFHNQYDIRQQPNFIITQLTSHSQFNIHHNAIIYPPQTSHFRTLTFLSSFQHSSRIRLTFHSCFNILQEFNQTFHRCFILHQGFNNISSISKSFQNINIIREKGGNHLHVPFVGFPCPIEGPILVATPKHISHHKSVHLQSVSTQLVTIHTSRILIFTIMCSTYYTTMQ
jgi:hypothetical protein